MLNRSLALTRQIHREYPISQIELWQQPRLVAGIALTLLAFPLERRGPQSFWPGILGRVGSWFFFLCLVTALGCGLDFSFLFWSPWRRRTRRAFGSLFFVQ